MGELQGELQRLAGTTQDAQGAANTWAGTTGRELVGALNAKAGTVGLELEGVCNRLALNHTGTNPGRSAPGALSTIPTLLSSSVGAWKASVYDATLGALLDLSGRGHHMVLGSAVGADTNDPRRDIFSGTKYLRLPGSAGNYASTPDSVPLSITGDIDIRCAVALDDWTPGVFQSVVAKYTGAGTRSYLLGLATTGRPQLFWSADGTAQLNSVATAAPVVVDSAILALRATLDVDDGAGNNVVTFYTKATSQATAKADCESDAGWTQLGTAVTTVTATSIFDSTSVLEVGTQGAGATNPVAGTVHAAVIKSGIDGTIVFSADFSKATASPSTFTEDSVNAATVTINRSATGRKSVIVDRTLLLFGTDDYLETPDHADFNFAAGESFTVAVAMRLYGTTVSQTVMAKTAGVGAGNPGFVLRRTGAAGGTLGFTIIDAAISVTDSSTAAEPVHTAMLLTGVRNVGTDTIECVEGGVSNGTTADTTTTTLANTEVLRIGRLSGAGTSYADMEFFGAAIFRRALSAAELARLATEFGV